MTHQWKESKLRNPVVALDRHCRFLSNNAQIGHSQLRLRFKTRRKKTIRCTLPIKRELSHGRPRIESGVMRPRSWISTPGHSTLTERNADTIASMTDRPLDRPRRPQATEMKVRINQKTSTQTLSQSGDGRNSLTPSVPRSNAMAQMGNSSAAPHSVVAESIRLAWIISDRPALPLTVSSPTFPTIFRSPSCDSRPWNHPRPEIVPPTIERLGGDS